MTDEYRNDNRQNDHKQCVSPSIHVNHNVPMRPQEPYAKTRTEKEREINGSAVHLKNGIVIYRSKNGEQHRAQQHKQANFVHLLQPEEGIDAIFPIIPVPKTCNHILFLLIL